MGEDELDRLEQKRRGELKVKENVCVHVCVHTFLVCVCGCGSMDDIGCVCMCDVFVLQHI